MYDLPINSILLICRHERFIETKCIFVKMYQSLPKFTSFCVVPFSKFQKLHKTVGIVQ